MDATSDDDRSDLIYGMPAIAAFLNIRTRQAYHLDERGDLPAFRLGGKVCARKTTLRDWLAAQEAAARTPAGE